MKRFHVASVFSDHMVLQRDKNICIFGEGPEGEKVTVEFAGKIQETKVKDDKWRIILPPMQAGTVGDMVVVCGAQARIYTDICLGEVWFAGGQSNMEFELSRSVGGREALQSERTDIRYYQVPRKSWIDSSFYEEEEEASWKLFSENWAQSWSAAAFFFAEKIARELSVTVGIIGCNWGGTSAVSWIPEDVIQENVKLRIYWEEYAELIRGIPEEKQYQDYREYEQFFEQWRNKAMEFWKMKPELTWQEVEKACGESRWPGPVNCVHPFRPAGLYHCMVERIIPYTMRGFLFYQGESDEERASLYECLFRSLIERWREDWGEEDMPFLFVQLPPYQNQEKKDDKSWCIIREAQMKVFRTVKNTGIAVTLDCGEWNELHPSDKRKIGMRLALQALYLVYGRIDAQDAFGPVYKACHPQGDKLEIVFDFSDAGVEAREILDVKSNEKGYLTEKPLFEIAGEDREFRKAEFEIKSNKLFLWSQAVKRPKYVRYFWYNYAVPIVYGKNGIPVAPFRNFWN